MDQTLYQRLNPVVRRIRLRRVAIALALIWFCSAIFVGGLVYFNRVGRIDPAGFFWPLAITTLAVSVVAFFIILIRGTRPELVVSEIERCFPELDASLITAIEQRPVDGAQLGFLQQNVLRQAINHSYINDWPTIIPGWHLAAASLAGLFSLTALAIALVCLSRFSIPIPPDPTIAFADAAVDNTNFEVNIEPGNTEVERGTSLLVLARFAQAFPPDAMLAYTDADNVESKSPMSKSLDDPVFGARVPAVQQPLTYRVEFADRESETFNVTVFDYPELVRADANLRYPTYTELENKLVQDFRRLNAVEGTVAELSFYVNKPVTSAHLFPDDSNNLPVQLTADSADPKKLTARIDMNQSKKYELRLTDDEGRENRSPPKFVFNALPNRPPDLKLLAPSRDIQASPLEEIQLRANAWDDYGLKAFGLSYDIPGKESKDVALEQKPTGEKRKQVDHLLELEELNVQPDDLVAYHFWAEDIGPDGEIRRVASDMYFAEVRHFDEIFRQGQAPPGGAQSQQQQQAGQNAQQAQELAELQKETINGTWKLIRREKDDAPSGDFLGDTELLADSQRSAIEKLVALAEQLEDETSKSFVESSRTHMNEAVIHLTQANRDADVSALTLALSSEQAAYQGLLKLRAREHEVVRQQQQQMGQASQNPNNRAQQQLDQLNLKEDENRYENEKTAQEQNQLSQEQQEDRQVLSRLRELARRQNDLNERVKELQSALEEAKTEEERDEIERRLKSLREQQEQMLRDTEELLERMQADQNQQRMAEESEKLEQTRENLQRASEALQQNEVSRAAAEGTRAQRDLEELRDEFQNRTAGQFTEQMRQMRNKAQELEEKEQAIAQELAGQQEPETDRSVSLRQNEDANPSLDQQLSEQKEAVDDLRTQMRTTIEEAETLEPLLAEELYETYRKSEVSRPDQALESARRSLNRGWIDDALTEEDRARQGIEQIRKGIEKAAESVLGDETQALKMAQETLRELNQELQQEIEQSDPANNQPESANADGPQQTSNEKEPQPANGERRNGQSQHSQPSTEQNDRQSPPGQNGQGDPQNQNESPPQEGQAGQPGDSPNGQRENGNQDRQTENGGGQPGDRQLDEAERLRQQIRDLGNNDGDPRNNQAEPRSGGGGNLRMMQPISGDDFRDWSDRLRDVEEMVADPDLRAEASRIREQAREIRKDLKDRHSAEPNWDLVKLRVAKPLTELQNRIAEEIMRRQSKDALVPLDRDPVPAEYQDAVRRYYERLGSGQ